MLDDCRLGNHINHAVVGSVEVGFGDVLVDASQLKRLKLAFGRVKFASFVGLDDLKGSMK